MSIPVTPSKFKELGHTYGLRRYYLIDMAGPRCALFNNSKVQMLKVEIGKHH